MQQRNHHLNAHHQNCRTNSPSITVLHLHAQVDHSTNGTHSLRGKPIEPDIIFTWKKVSTLRGCHFETIVGISPSQRSFDMHRFTGTSIGEFFYFFLGNFGIWIHECYTCSGRLRIFFLKYNIESWVFERSGLAFFREKKLMYIHVVDHVMFQVC